MPIVEQFRSNILRPSQNPKAIIVNPTRELVTQTYTNAKFLTDQSKGDDFSLKVLQLYGGTDWRMNQRDLSRGSDIIISTPGRTNDLINRGMLDMSEIQCIVLDEADRMLDMGFKDDIYKIIQAVPKKNLENLQFILFSATINQ